MTRVSPRQYSPDIAIPPGATIQEILGSLCMSQEDLADRMDKRPSHVNEIISGRRPVTVDIAISLERVLGSPASFWLNLEKNYQLTLARLREAASREQDIAWMRDVIPITELVKRGIVPSDRDPGVRLQAVLRFFAVSSVDAWKEYWERQITGAVAFRRSQAKPNMWAEWLRGCALAS
jgi:HTH-type transcriptional regulator/antitoxin HigA